MSAMDNIGTTREPQGTEERMLLNHAVSHKTSFLAAKILDEEHVLQVCQSGAGFYLGAQDLENGEPISRDSGYYTTAEEAQVALDERSWLQRMDP